MRSKIATQFLSFVFGIFLIHLLLVYTNILAGTFKMALFMDGILLLIILLGNVFVFNRKGGDEKFVLRFMVLTVVQFLGFLSFMAVVIVKKMEDYRYWVLSTLLLFALILFIQTIFLVKSLKAKA